MINIIIGIQLHLEHTCIFPGLQHGDTDLALPLAKSLNYVVY
jgi:hypothetical protein